DESFAEPRARDIAQPAPPLYGREGALASRLERQQLQQASTSCHQHALFAFEQRARERSAILLGVGARRDNFERLAAPARPRTGPGVVGAGHALDIGGRRTPVDRAIRFLKQSRVSRQAVLLWCRIELAGRIARERPDQQLSAKLK